MSKKRSKPKEEEMPRGWLLGWKDIAGYIGCSVKCAHDYTKRFNLPVQSLPGGRYEKAVAIPSELDDWLRKSSKRMKIT